MSNPRAGGLEPYIEPCPACRGASVRFCRTCKEPQDTCSHAGNYERRAVEDSATRNSAMIGNSVAKTYIAKADALQAEVEALRTALRPPDIRAWIQALPEDAVAQVVRAYEDAEWEGSTTEADQDVFAAACRAFRDALSSLVGAPERDPDAT